MKKILVLTVADFKNIIGDRILLLAGFVPFILLAVMELGLPFINHQIKRYVDFDLSQYYIFIKSFLLTITPMMIGILVGFLILDERDEGIITYFFVTPLSKSKYILYRILNPLVVNFVFSLFIVLIISHGEVKKFFYLSVIVLMASIEAPMVTLFLAAFASNKVEGLVWAKGAGLFLIIPSIACLIKTDWQFIAGIFPPFWVSKAFIECFQALNGMWVYCGIGMIVHIIYIGLLYKKFKTRIS